MSARTRRYDNGSGSVTALEEPVLVFVGLDVLELVLIGPRLGFNELVKLELEVNELVELELLLKEPLGPPVFTRWTW